MKKITGIRLQVLRLVVLFALTLFSASAIKANNHHFKKFEGSPIEGRWDLTVTVGGKELPSWLEVRHSGTHHLIGYFVGVGGSARPISKVNFSDGKMSFTIPPQWEKEDNDIVVEGTLTGDNLSGTIIGSDGKTNNWVGVRAPSLWRTSPPAWGKPITLFNGKNLNGWHAMGENQWQAVDGILRSPKPGSNLVTDQTFNDFKLHIEFRYPKESNSGVYLRGRYEVQVADNKGLEPLSIYFGGIYGFISPTEMVAKEPGEWQSYDITLVGRIVTIVANGKMIICSQTIPGITGGAINSKEGEPGPILLQGDHGTIEYRNIVITPAK
jgi:hypothetical protein